MAENILESYFIRVGALPDTASFAKLGYVIKDSEKIIQGFTINSATGFLKFEAVAVGALAAVGLGLIGLADKTAMTDQSYRLFGLRMLMTKETARAMQTALDELGATIDEVAYDPELNKRFQYLYEQNIKLGRAMGSSFDQNMKSIRDYRMEVKRFTTEFEFLLGGSISKLFEKVGLGSGDVLQQLQNLNDWFTSNLPSISDEVSDDLVPVWNDFKLVMRDVFDIAKTGAGDFQYLFGVLTNDESIQTTDVNARSLATTLLDVIDDVTKIILTFDIMGRMGGHAFMAIANSALAAFEAVKASMTFGSADEAKKYINKAADESVALAADARDYFSNKDHYANPDFSGVNRFNDTHQRDPVTGKRLPMVRPEVFARSGTSVFGSNASSGTSTDKMRSLAEMVSSQTGIPANIILDQWAHETGGFSSSVFKKNNNAAGIENADKSYRSYGSLEEFANDYSKVISGKRYRDQGLLQSKDIEHFAAALKRGGYYEDSYKNYAAGMEHWDKQLSGGGITINQQTIVLPPGTTPEQGSKIVSDGMRDVLKVRDQRTMAQTAGGAFH